jgi:hypothetical protein
VQWSRTTHATGQQWSICHDPRTLRTGTAAGSRPSWRILWTWQSPDGFHSGPNYPAIAVADAQGLLVVLVRPRELRTVYVMRLDPFGRPAWPEPRALPWPGLFDIELTLVVGHPTGTFHVAWFPGSLGWFDAEAEPLWDEPIPHGQQRFLPRAAVRRWPRRRLVHRLWVLRGLRHTPVRA